MNATKLSRAIRYTLATQMGTAALAMSPGAIAQQAPQPVAPVTYVNTQGQSVQAQVVPGQVVQPMPSQPVYAQPQVVMQAPALYAQPQPSYQPTHQQMYQPTYQSTYQPTYQVTYPPAASPSMVYAQPAPQMVQQPVVVQASGTAHPSVQYPTVMQPAVAQPQLYANATPVAPGSYVPPMYPQVAYNTGAYPPGGAVMVQPMRQAPVTAYAQTPTPTHSGGLVYAYPMAMPQGAVMVHPATGQLMTVSQSIAPVDQPVAQLPSSNVTPRLQTGSLGKPATDFPNQPTQILTGDQLRQVNAVNVEEAINTLPQVIPGLGRTSNNEGDGRATVDLRGLGETRTAVLVNGRPFAASGESGTANLNAIPQGLIKQVEVTTGGSSVAYGSGAMAGAVNFVLDDNYQGVELNVSHQATPEREAGLSSADLTLGTDFAEGRGNFAFSVGASEREPLTQDARIASAFPFFDDVDQDGNPVLINGGSSGVSGTSIFSGALGDYAPESFGITFDQNGQIRPFEFPVNNQGGDFYNYAPSLYLQLPQTREHATALASFEFAQAAELYGLGMYSSTRSARQQAPTPIFLSGTQFTLDDSPFLTADSQQILSDAFGDGVDTDGDGIDDTGTAFIRRRLAEVGERRFENETVSEYVQAGLRGDLGGALEYDVYASRSNVESSELRLGGVSASRFRQAQLLDLEADPQGGVCQDQSNNGSDVACAPANIFGPGNISPEAVEFLAATNTLDARYEQSIQGARLTGKLGDLSGGQARITLGAERRQDDYKQVFGVQSDTSPDDIVSLLGSRSSYDGQTTSEAVYADIYLPLASRESGAELLDLELGYRLTEHSTAPDFASYGAALSFTPAEFVNFRAAYNVAHRAPNMGELFTPQTESFSSVGDPCSASGAPFGGLTQAQFDACVATGVPAELVGTAAINPPSSQVRALSGGNPDLEAEQAETLTVGVQVGLPLGDEGYVSVGGDYFVMDGSNAIALLGGGVANALSNCYSPDGSGGELSPFCDTINRNPDGTIESVELFARNEAQFHVEGVDLFAGVSLPALGGNLHVDFNGTVLDAHNFSLIEGAEALECAGRFGLLCGGPIPQYSHRVSAGWTTDNLTAAVIWRHLGEVTDDDDSRTFFREKIEARDYLDAEVSLDFADSIGLAVGVQNLTDVAPPVVGDNQQQANTYPATYDTFGRTYFVRITGSSSLDGKQ